MAYEMLTGAAAVHRSRPPQAVLAAHVIEEAHPVQHRRPAVPPMLATLVMRNVWRSGPPTARSPRPT